MIEALLVATRPVPAEAMTRRRTPQPDRGHTNHVQQIAVTAWVSVSLVGGLVAQLVRNLSG